MQKNKWPVPIELNGDPTDCQSKRHAALAFGGDPQPRALNCFWEVVLNTIIQNKAFISWPRAVMIIWGF